VFPRDRTPNYLIYLEETMIGTCSLCLEESDLQDSHLLPAALYKRARYKDNKNPHPLVYSSRGERQTSKQARRHLLCSSCEQRFHERGENWTLRHAATTPTEFALRDLLLANQAIRLNEHLYYFTTASIPEIDSDALGYFALSVVWRASVCDWAIDEVRIPQLQLGPFQEQLRRYLLGYSDLPDNVAVLAVACSQREVYLMTNMPQTRMWGEYRSHFFDIPGVSFMVDVGARIPEHARAMCLFRGVGRPLFYSPVAQLSNAQAYATLRQRYSPP
jgi:hypothetical protein